MSGLTGSIALVTGATGFVGGALAHRLANDGVLVRALARRSGRDSYIRNVENITIVMGDITDEERMKEVTEGCDYVFHAAAAIHGKLDYQRRVNVGGMKNIARAAVSANIKRLVHVSTSAVYGYQYHGTIIEDMPHIPGNVPYNISKSETETMLKEIAERHNLSYSINRPGMIYGPRSGAWTKTVLNIAKRQPIPFFGDGQGTVYPIFIDDLLDMLILQATHPKADRQAFNCVYQPQPTAREYLEQYMKLVDNNNWRTYPIGLAKFLAPIGDFVLHLLGQPQDIQEMLRMIERKNIYSMEKAKNLLGWQPQTSLEEGIQQTIPYLKEAGLL